MRITQIFWKAKFLSLAKFFEEKQTRGKTEDLLKIKVSVISNIFREENINFVSLSFEDTTASEAADELATNNNSRNSNTNNNNNNFSRNINNHNNDNNKGGNSYNINQSRQQQN